MQDALGADFADINRIAQPSSSDPDTGFRLHSISGSSFFPLLQASARRAIALSGILRGRRLRASGSRRQVSRNTNLHRRECDIGAVFGCGLDRSSTAGALLIRYPADWTRGSCRRAAEGRRASGAGRNMMCGCLCVCHRQFQNEVIGG
jgi:hypothetical protein